VVAACASPLATAFGENGDFGHDFRGGASGDRTAFNNSTLCGNPQGAGGQLGD